MNLASLVGIARGDFLERIRHRSFLVTTAIMLWACFMAVPDLDAGYGLLSFDNVRGEYTSTWIGLMFAVVCASVIPLPAFYLVRGALRRDFERHTSTLLAAAPLTRTAWMGGKLLSNLALLTVMLVIISAGALMMLFWRGVGEIDLLQLLLPIWLVTLPVFGIVAGFAILLETIPGLRGGLGNILVFFIWAGAMGANLSLSTDNPEGRSAWTDPMGLGPVLHDMREHVRATVPDYKGGVVVGIGDPDVPDTLLRWPEYRWSFDYALSRLVWLFAGALFLPLAAIGFRRHESPRRSFFRRREETGIATASAPPAVGTLPAVSVRGVNPLRLVHAELVMILREQRWWWWLVLGGLLASALAAAPGEGLRFAVMLLWIWPVLAWSPLGCRGDLENVTPLLAATAAHGARQVIAAWLAGVLVGLVLVLPALLKLLPLDPNAALALLGAPLFVPALALALGRLSGSTRLFEAIYIAWWYVATQGAGAADFINLDAVGGGEFSVAQSVGYAFAALLLLFVAVAATHWRQAGKRG